MNAITADVPLAPWCTIGVGGPAKWFVAARSEADVCEALNWARERRLPVLVLGGGSNLVISDRGFRGLVLQIAIIGSEVRTNGADVHYAVGAGELWDSFVARAVADEVAGIECLSGIPGLVGGTPVQNVGAYGQEVSQTIRSVRVVDRETGNVRDLAARECGFGYRTSRFKHADAGRFIVTRVEFALARGGAPTIAYADVIDYFATRARPPSLAEVRDGVIEIRSRKGMVIREGNPANRSCGSFFVNPVIHRAQLVSMAEAPRFSVDHDQAKVPAAWLIERSGFPRGHVAGPVGLSPFQAQGLINRGGASASDVVGLAVAIKRAVLETFDVCLVPEPVFVGFDDDPVVAWLLDPAAQL